MLTSIYFYFYFFLLTTQAEQNTGQRRTQEDIAHPIFNISEFITELGPDSLA